MVLTNPLSVAAVIAKATWPQCELVMPSMKVQSQWQTLLNSAATHAEAPETLMPACGADICSLSAVQGMMDNAAIGTELPTECKSVVFPGGKAV